jgi:HAD superfamily hydrolase (TIGR01549 family)
MDSSRRLRSHRDRSQPEITPIKNTPQAVGFDVDHTLGIDNKLERVAFLRLLDVICGEGGRCLGTLAEESVRIDDLLSRQRSGAFTIDEAVAQFVSERGAKPSGTYTVRYKQMALESVPHFFVPQPDARLVLADLRRRGIPCAILSNGWSPLQQEKARCLAFEGPVLVSDALGAQKPDAAAFHALANALGADPHDVAYVGDNPESDAAAAIAAGMRGIWLDAEGVKYPPDLPKPTAVIHKLAELLALL